MKEIECPKCGELLKIDELEYNFIVLKIKTKEFDKEVLEALTNKLKSIEEIQSLKVKAKLSEIKKEYSDKIAAKDSELQKIKTDLLLLETKIAQIRTEEKNKYLDEIQELKDKLHKEILGRNSDITIFNEKLELLQQIIDKERNFKLAMSTKMIGESLERHCASEFSKIRTMGCYQNAVFEKDNEVIEGTKGDFIFKDYIDNEEYISIMFEMKNESDTTKTKHKNEHFFEKLDLDRKKKGCEYAVLVTMLEADSEEYNAGIVDVSYRYDKMFVIRPQFFLPIIGLLSSVSRKNVIYKKQLRELKNHKIDVNRFVEHLNAFKSVTNKFCEKIADDAEDGILFIDRVIKGLENIKKKLISNKLYSSKLLGVVKPEEINLLLTEAHTLKNTTNS